MASIEEKVEVLLQPIIENLGYKLYDVQYVKEASSYYLRIFIEKENGTIDLDDCETVNNGINDILDTVNYIKEQYFLEVSSTGLEKVLRKDSHLQEHMGCEIMVSLFKPIAVPMPLPLKKEAKTSSKKSQKEEKTKELIGILKAFDAKSITLALGSELEPELDPEPKLESGPKSTSEVTSKLTLESDTQSYQEYQKRPENQTLTIERKDIAMIKTVYHWEDEI